MLLEEKLEETDFFKKLLLISEIAFKVSTLGTIALKISDDCLPTGTKSVIKFIKSSYAFTTR